MWEIYAYQNADSLFGIFNAAAAIHASSDYRAALAAVVFCGFSPRWWPTPSPRKSCKAGSGWVR